MSVISKILLRTNILGWSWRGWKTFLQLNFFQVFRGGIMIDENTKMPILNYPNTIVQIDKGGRTRQTLWRAVQMLTQKLSCQTIHDCPKVVPLHYESEWQ